MLRSLVYISPPLLLKTSVSVCGGARGREKSRGGGGRNLVSFQALVISSSLLWKSAVKSETTNYEEISHLKWRSSGLRLGRL